MNILRLLPFILACAISVPTVIQASDSKNIYTPPESINQELSLSSSTPNSVTFKYEVKSILGNSKDVKLSAQVLGRDDINPVPDSKFFKEVKEGENAVLEFVLPITKEQAQDKSIKIQASIEYLPDYNAMIKYVEKDKDNKYFNIPLKESLLNLLTTSEVENSKSMKATKYIPEK